MFVFISIGLVVLYLGYNMVKHRNLNYWNTLKRQKRNMYCLIIIGIALGWLSEQLTVSDWKTIVGMIGLGVVIDVLIFQSPTIYRIGNTELNRELDTAIENNEFTIGLMERKTEWASIVFQFSSDYFDGNQVQVLTLGDYLLELRRFLEEFTRKFELPLAVYQKPDSSSSEDLGHILLTTSIRTGASLTVSEKDDIIKLLEKQTVAKLGTYAIVMPHSGLWDVIIVVENRYDRLTSIDAPLLVMLARLFDVQVDKQLLSCQSRRDG